MYASKRASPDRAPDPVDRLENRDIRVGRRSRSSGWLDSPFSTADVRLDLTPASQRPCHIVVSTLSVDVERGSPRDAGDRGQEA